MCCAKLYTATRIRYLYNVVTAEYSQLSTGIWRLAKPVANIWGVSWPQTPKDLCEKLSVFEA